jgi:hypothetical protein
MLSTPWIKIVVNHVSALLKFIVANESNLIKKINVFHICLQVKRKTFNDLSVFEIWT